MGAARYRRYRINSIVAIVAVLAILTGLNFLSARHHRRVDLTSGGRFSLSDQTRKIVKGLKADVQIYAFFQGTDAKLDDLLREYAYLSPHFRYEFIDPDKKPALAKTYEVSRYGTIVLAAGDKEEKVLETSEEKITNALIKVSREGKKTVYFIDGHGEKDIDDVNREGYSAVKKALQGENYDVKKWVLAREDSIPSNCSVLVVCAPRVEPFPRELELIDRYLRKGGSALALLEPDRPATLEGLLKPWGVRPGNDLVLDVSGVGRLFGVGPTIPLVSTYEYHDITKDFKVMTFYPTTRSVSPRDSLPAGLSVRPLLKTTRSSWGETRIEGADWKFDEKEDLRGPVPLAVAVTREIEGDGVGGEEAPAKKPSARMVVFGDSDFASNVYFTASGNGDLFLNTVNWLAGEEEMIAIRPKEAEDRRVAMTARQTKMVFYGTVIALPLLVLGVGIVVRVRRR